MRIQAARILFLLFIFILFSSLSAQKKPSDLLLETSQVTPPGNYTIAGFGPDWISKLETEGNKRGQLYYSGFWIRQ